MHSYQWRTKVAFLMGINLTKFYPIISYDIRKKGIVVQVQHTNVINCTVARLQLHNDI